METTNTKSDKYRDTAGGFYAKLLSEHFANNNIQLRSTKKTSKSMTFDETKLHETSEKNFVPVRIAYKTFDPKDGSDERVNPIIFQHGALSSKENWENIPQVLADETKRKVYALDARNHGDSEWSDASDCDTLAQDLIHFMTTNGITKCILIGHSMGGICGLRSALKQPDMFEMLFLEDCAVSPFSPKMQDLVPRYLRFLQHIISEIPSNIHEDDVWRFIKDEMEKLIPKNPSKVKKHGSKSAPFAFKREADGHYSLNGNVEAVIRYVTSSWSEPTGTYEGPAFFIYGTESPFEIFKDADCIKRHFPKAELIPIEGAGHAIHMNYPDAFTEIILKHLKNPQSIQIFQKNKL